jgi:hypothetical protein
MNAVSPVPTGLPALEQRLRQDLEWLEWPAKDWVPPREHEGQRVRDVVIVGAGMCGLAAAGALKGLGLSNIILLDRAPAGREGPWVTYARMETLRSPKQLTGPALGLPALTFRAWYEAQYGRAAWEALGKIPRPLWMDYLVWYRKVLSLPVVNETAITHVGRRRHPAGRSRCGARRSRMRAGSRAFFARHLVLATGRDGLGGALGAADFAGTARSAASGHTAPTRSISRRLERQARRRGRCRRLGHGQCRDRAGAGRRAASTCSCAARTLPRINKFTGIGSQGVVQGVAGLPDEWKWRFLRLRRCQAQTPPPRDSDPARVAPCPCPFPPRQPGPRLAVQRDGAIMALSSRPRGRYALDFLIFATGFNGRSRSSGQSSRQSRRFIRFWK